MRNDISDWLESLGNSNPYPNDFDAAAQELVQLQDIPDANITFPPNDLASLTITLTFLNGNKVTFSWTKGSVPTMTDARDGHNNTVPMTAGSVPGGYNFNSNGQPDLNNFIDYLHNMYNIDVIHACDFGPSIGCASAGAQTVCTLACP